MWVSILALIISISSLVYTIYRNEASSFNARIQRRMDLLLKLYLLKSKYEHGVELLGYKLSIINRHAPQFITDGIRDLQVYKKYYTVVGDYIKNLEGESHIGDSSLIQINMRIQQLLDVVERESKGVGDFNSHVDGLLSKFKEREHECSSKGSEA